jgi:hypothetical protein
MAATLRPVIASAPNFRGYLHPNELTLCVGAGISRNLAPTWFELANLLVNDTFGVNLDGAAFAKLSSDSGWSLDAWIQAAANEFIRSGRNLDDFTALIESHLYARIKGKAKGCKFEKHLPTVFNFPQNASKDMTIQIYDFLEHTFPTASVFAVGRFLIKSAKGQKPPRGIISFNADTFHETYIDLFLRREHYQGPGPHSHPRYFFTSIIRPGPETTKIPIFHCHGSITPFYRAGKNPYDSRDRLIFLEQEYLATSTSRASWAQTVFLFHAHSSTLAFCGLSMSDANIRRWMSIIETENQIEMKRLSKDQNVNAKHIWLRPQPSTPQEETVYLASLLHLGIRPAWIKDWNTLEAELANLGGVP